MWDRPEILNRISNVLIALALLLALTRSSAIVVHLPEFALREVRVSGSRATSRASSWRRS